MTAGLDDESCSTYRSTAVTAVIYNLHFMKLGQLILVCPIGGDESRSGHLRTRLSVRGVLPQSSHR